MNYSLKHISNTFSSSMPSRLLDRFMLLLIFMLPLCGNLIKSWYSTLFSLIALASLFYIKQGWPLLDKYQKSMAYALMLYFSVFLLNATLLGWHSAELKVLGAEIRLAFFIPLLCMAAVIPATRIALYMGLIGSLVFFLGQAFYELQVIQQLRMVGAYNPLRISAMPLVALAILLPWLYLKKSYVAAVLVVVCCILVIFYSQGRMAMIAAMIILILFCIISIRQTLNKMIALTGIVLIVITLVSTPQIQQRFSESEPLVQYITKEKQYDANEMLGSWVTHYMMLEASWLMFKENPVLGVGNGHYSAKTHEYIDAQKVHPIVRHELLVTPHTLIAEIVVSKGIVGLLTFSLFIIMALRLAYHRRYEGIGMGLFIMCILLTGISEDWWVRTGSFVAIMVTFLAILSTKTQNSSVIRR
jgi:O-antigen ligase